MDPDVEHYPRTIVDERQAGRVADSDEARESHLKLATAYERRLRGLAAKKPRTTLRIITSKSAALRFALLGVSSLRRVPQS